MTTIIEERLKALDSIPLLRGAHDSNEQMCAMEAAAWIAGEEHSDRPRCVSPVLGAFVRSWNDALDDEERQALKPCIPRMIGTAGDGHDEERAWMAVDWLVRVCTPAWLDLAGLKDSAEALRSLPPITKATVGKAQPTVKEAREAAVAAAKDAAAGDATWAVFRARDAARNAVRAAAGDAAWAAVRARTAVWHAGDDAWAAAWNAAGDAAWAAAVKAKLDSEPRFAPVKAELHRSAHELLARMIDGPFGGEDTHE